MSPIIYGLNKYYGHKNHEALFAASKQAGYTFLAGAYVTKLSKKLSVKYKNKIKRYCAGILIPSIITISLTYGIHNLKGTPEPIISTIPIMILVPTFGVVFSYKERKKTFYLQ